MKIVAHSENLDEEFVRRQIKNGKLIIFYDQRKEIQPVGCGTGLSTKINANVGMSSLNLDYNSELEKAKAVERYGADRIMDLSVDGNISLLRKKIIQNLKIPIGIVSVYEACRNAINRKNNYITESEDLFIKTLEEQIKTGINYITIHADITRELVTKVIKSSRIIKIPARGGSLLAGWMIHNLKENPYNKNFEYICELIAENDLVLSIGNSVRAGTIVDSFDQIEIDGIIESRKLIKRAKKIGVQIQLESGGHIPINKIQPYIKFVKKTCYGVPMGTLGPLVTDVGLGFDHVVQSIGQVIGTWAGLNYVSVVTRSEHICIPSLNDLIEAINISLLSVHAGMIARGTNYIDRDREIAVARNNMDIKKQLDLCYNSDLIKNINYNNDNKYECSMCGDFCAHKILKEAIINENNW